MKHLTTFCRPLLFLFLFLILLVKIGQQSEFKRLTSVMLLTMPFSRLTVVLFPLRIQLSFFLKQYCLPHIQLQMLVVAIRNFYLGHYVILQCHLNSKVLYIFFIYSDNSIIFYHHVRHQHHDFQVHYEEVLIDFFLRTCYIFQIS